MTQETLTPTEKLKELRKTVKALSDELGKVVIYDDAITENLLQAAEKHATQILQTIHDDDHVDIVHAIHYHLTGENL